MDTDKNVYEITHDPFEIVSVKSDLLTFLKKWGVGNYGNY